MPLRRRIERILHDRQPLADGSKAEDAGLARLLHLKEKEIELALVQRRRLQPNPAAASNRSQQSCGFPVGIAPNEELHRGPGALPFERCGGVVYNGWVGTLISSAVCFPGGSE